MVIFIIILNFEAQANKSAILQHSGAMESRKFHISFIFSIFNLN